MNTIKVAITCIIVFLFGLFLVATICGAAANNEEEICAIAAQAMEATGDCQCTAAYQGSNVGIQIICTEGNTVTIHQAILKESI